MVIIDRVRRFGLLVCGWVLGGAVVVLLGAPTVGAPTSGRPVRRSPIGVVAPAVAAAADVDAGAPAERTSALLVPVVGISANELRDSYEEARGGGRVHRAIDIRAPRGTAVIAAVDGTVRKLFTSKAGGLTIYQFDVKEEHNYYYAHLDRYAPNISEGLFVKAGTVIGYVGTSGNAPVDTPHLHFAIEVLTPTKEWWKGEPVNPYPLLTRRASAPLQSSSISAQASER